MVDMLEFICFCVSQDCMSSFFVIVASFCMVFWEHKIEFFWCLSVTAVWIVHVQWMSERPLLLGYSLIKKRPVFGILSASSFISITKISNFEERKNVNNYFFNVLYSFSIIQ